MVIPRGNSRHVEWCVFVFHVRVTRVTLQAEARLPVWVHESHVTARRLGFYPPDRSRALSPVYVSLSHWRPAPLPLCARVKDTRQLSCLNPALKHPLFSPFSLKGAKRLCSTRSCFLMRASELPCPRHHFVTISGHPTFLSVRYAMFGLSMRLAVVLEEIPPSPSLDD